MSEDWKFYPCQMGDHTAFVFYDHGMRETINEVAPPQLLKVRVTFKQPREDGLSSREEYPYLCALEDAVQAAAKQYGGIYVGRVTVGGHRYLHIFVSGSEADWASRLADVGKQHGYDLRCVLKLDPARDGYWRDLFPTEDDWQVIQDLRVIEVLEKEGDDAKSSRRIDHWAYFPTRDVSDGFSQWLAEERYQIHANDVADDGKFRVRFSHEGTLELSDITSHTIKLRRKAAELGGDYDGWETSVCKTAS